MWGLLSSARQYIPCSTTCPRQYFACAQRACVVCQTSIHLLPKPLQFIFRRAKNLNALPSLRNQNNTAKEREEKRKRRKKRRRKYTPFPVSSVRRLLLLLLLLLPECSGGKVTDPFLLLKSLSVKLDGGVVSGRRSKEIS